MRARALTPLIARPVTAAGVALMAPLLMLGLVAAGRGRADRVFFAQAVGLVAGLTIGTALVSAARCSFAWTLPRFRRDSLMAFVACGAVVAGAIGAILAVGGAGIGAVGPALVGFAGFTIGGAFALTPEGWLLQAFLWLPFLALQPSRAGVRGWFEASTEPLGLTLVVVVAGAALRASFGTRTWRWAAFYHSAGSNGSLANRWKRMPWWPVRRPVRPHQAKPASFPAASTSHCVIAAIREQPRATQVFRLVGILVWVTVWVALVRAGNVASTVLEPTVLLPFVGVVVGVAGPSSLRAHFPWSRVLHRRVAYLRQVAAALCYAFVVAPAAPAFVALSATGVTCPIDQVARVIAATVVLLPLVQLVHGPQPGASNVDGSAAGWLFGVLLVVATLWGRFVDFVLPAFVTSAAGQAVVLGLMIGVSQVLYWRYLGRHFATGDLV